MKLVIFDYDGVIMDTFLSLIEIYKDISREFNLDLPKDPKYYKELFELDWRETCKKLNIVSKEDIEKQEQIYAKGLHKYGHLVRPYKDIPFVLFNLSNKYNLALVTNNLKNEIDYRLKRYNLDRYFKAVFTCEDGELKPDPDLLVKCMEHFNTEPEDTVFIGDMDGDITSGKAAKIGKIIAVTYGYHLKHKLEEADVIVNSPKELLKVL